MQFDAETAKILIPLLAVVVTIVLTVYAVPRITQRAKDREKESEIKTELVELINASVVKFALAIQFAERKASTQAQFDESYREWEIGSATILAKVRSYFGHTPVAEDLASYMAKLTAFYALTGIHDPDRRKTHVADLKAFYGADATDWILLEDQSKKRDDWMNWYGSWWQLQQRTLSMKDELVQKLLAARVEFHSKLSR